MTHVLYNRVKFECRINYKEINRQKVVEFLGSSPETNVQNLISWHDSVSKMVAVKLIVFDHNKLHVKYSLKTT